MSRLLSSAEQALRDAALDYHRLPTRGKIGVTPTKPLANPRDLSLAYSPGVAYACMAIAEDPARAADYTSRANLVGVVTNGSAVLGLGAIGPLAGKPVMEGKGCLFKQFAGIDVFDIELAEDDPDRLVEIIAALEPTLGGINLEDIKAPECFHIERRLRERLNIPVFHDDQHGTAIISAAALLNALELVGKAIGEVRVAVSGAGAAAIACLDLMVSLGLRPANVFVCDSRGVIRAGRGDALDESKQRYCQQTTARTLAEVVAGADVFLGCSTAGVLTAEMLRHMAPRPVILALANPEPEIRPEIARAARPDCIVATGRSDYPNQVNNVLCFPYIFRGALDCGARRITEAMKLACVHELAALAKAEVDDEVAAAYAGRALRFGPDYLIPTPFDPRLIQRIAPAVARAAAESGVATRPIADLAAYRASLARQSSRSGAVMHPVFEAARARPARVVYAEGEDERVLRAVQVVCDEGLARPVLVGRPEPVRQTIERAGLRLRPGADFELVDPDGDPRLGACRPAPPRRGGRDGVSPEAAQAALGHANTAIAAMLLRRGEADAMLCGLAGRFDAHLDHVRALIGAAEPGGTLATMNALMLEQHTLFIADTLVNEEPAAEQLAQIAHLAADEVRRFGLLPKVAFVSHSTGGASSRPSARRMRQARELFVRRAPHIACEGELQGDAALSADIRRAALPATALAGSANLLVLPNIEAANILFHVLRVAAGRDFSLGPILLGAAAPVHILTPADTLRRVVDMTALAVSDVAARPGPVPVAAGHAPGAVMPV